MTAIQEFTSVSAATETDIRTSTADETLVVRIINESGAAGVINGLSQSTTSATQNAAGNLLPAGFPINDKTMIEISPVIGATAFEFIVLNCSVAVTTNVSGVTQ